MLQHKRKRQRSSSSHKLNHDEKPDLFDGLHDDLIVLILRRLAASASRPLDFVNILFTCKRLNMLAMHPHVLSVAGRNTFAIQAKNWSETAHRFLRHCAATDNPHAAYTLGMIQFYCLQNRGNGVSLMAKAAMKSHVQALYSLAVIQFNGSGGSKNDKDLRAGVVLCARAACLGHVDALRELGHCLQDGYGVPQNVSEGRSLLIQANARELGLTILRWKSNRQNHQQEGKQVPYVCSLLSDFGCKVPTREVHPVSRFLKDWFGLGFGLLMEGLRMCSHSECGRPETRPHEFRRCSVCGLVNYCSRGCQALDWKLRHEEECVPMYQWIINEDEENIIDGDNANEVELN